MIKNIDKEKDLFSEMISVAQKLYGDQWGKIIEQQEKATHISKNVKREIVNLDYKYLRLEIIEQIIKKIK